MAPDPKVVQPSGPNDGGTNAKESAAASIGDAEPDQVSTAKESFLERWRAEATSRAERAYDAAADRAPWVEIPVETGRRWLSANGGVLSGHLAYRVFVFLVPVVMLLAAGLGWAGDSADLANQAEQRFGLGKALSDSISGTSKQVQGSRAQLSLGALSAVLIASWGLLGAFRHIFAVVWGVETKSDRSVIDLLARFLGAVMLFVLGSTVRQAITTSGPIASVAGLVITILANTLLFLGLSWLLPRRPTTLVDLLPGSMLTAVILTMLNVGGSWYFTSKLERAAELYGVIGIVVVVLSYLFFAGQAVVLGAVTNTVWADRDEVLNAAAERRQHSPA